MTTSRTINLPMDVAREIAKYNNQTQEIERLETEIERLKKLETQSALSCPVLFAKPGDLFWHPTAEEYSRGDKNIFRFEKWVDNRTEGAGLGEAHPCNTEGGRFVFEWIEGGNGIDCSRYGALNGGVRDLIGAFPVCVYVDPDDPENADRISLPAHMISGFRMLDVRYQ
jgi:hypothetical protein